MYRVCAECFLVDASEIEGSHVPKCRHCKGGDLIVLDRTTYQCYLLLVDEWLLKNQQMTNRWQQEVVASRQEFSSRLFVLVSEGNNHEISV